MKKYLLLLFLYSSFTVCEAQDDAKIDVAKLIKITQTSDYYALVKLTQDLHYKVFDSTTDKAGSVFYYARQLKLNGNILACGTDSKLKLKQFTFGTYDRDTYLNLKKQLVASGLKSTGKSTGGFPEITEAEDFEGKGILASASAKKNDRGDLSYEFMFLKF